LNLLELCKKAAISLDLATSVNSYVFKATAVFFAGGGRNFLPLSFLPVRMCRKACLASSKSIYTA
jgi:hypothetical protein